MCALTEKTTRLAKQRAAEHSPKEKKRLDAEVKAAIIDVAIRRADEIVGMIKKVEAELNDQQARVR